MKIPNNTLESKSIVLTFNQAEKQIPDDPNARVSLKRVYVRKEEIEFKYEEEDINRIIKKFGEDRFCLINFNGVEGEYIQGVLLKGVNINGTLYNFFGHSSSQIKERSCFLFNAPMAEIEKILNSMGDFSKIKNVAKKAARIGLLFSSAVPTIEIHENWIKMGKDYEHNGHNFSDGCGMISRDLSKQIAQIREINFRKELYIPSVFQIRFKGSKGVLVTTPLLDPKKAKKKDEGHSDAYVRWLPKQTLYLRPSLKKFDCKELNMLCHVDHSKPYKFTFVNQQFILLLSALGVRDSVFLDRQQTYYNELKRLRTDPTVAFKYE